MISTEPKHKIDWLLMIITAAFCAFGMKCIPGVTNVWVAVGMIAGAFVSLSFDTSKSQEPPKPHQ